jgi:hypothetical protein
MQTSASPNKTNGMSAQAGMPFFLSSGIKKATRITGWLFLILEN